MNKEDDAECLPVGTKLGAYVIRCVVGRGGFGISYLADDEQLAREVVLKEHFPSAICERAEDGQVQAKEGLKEVYQTSLHRFVEEMQIVAGLQHAGIVPVHEVFQGLNTAYAVMKYVDGQPLDKHFANIQYDSQRITDILIKLLHLLSYIHQQGVCHRDIKPSNILVEEDDTPWILDFGAAIAHPVEHTLTVMASPRFSPPEQYEAHANMGPWTDLYALSRSFTVALGEEGLQACPKYIRNSLKRAARTEISERYQNANAWLKDIQPANKSRWVAILLIIAILLILATLNYQPTSKKEETIPNTPTQEKKQTESIPSDTTKTQEIHIETIRREPTIDDILL